MLSRFHLVCTCGCCEEYFSHINLYRDFPRLDQFCVLTRCTNHLLFELQDFIFCIIQFNSDNKQSNWVHQLFFLAALSNSSSIIGAPAIASNFPLTTNFSPANKASDFICTPQPCHSQLNSSTTAVSRSLRPQARHSNPSIPPSASPSPPFNPPRTPTSTPQSPPHKQHSHHGARQTPSRARASC